MISEPGVVASAQAYLAGLASWTDPLLRPWRNAKLGDPQLVSTPELEPSFWLVPVVAEDRVLGYIETALDGTSRGHGYFYSDARDLSQCPAVVTRITSEEARKQAQPVLEAYVGGQYSEPVFVHDGPHNRLAWLIEVRKNRDLVSRVFVTPGYVYERRKGEKGPQGGRRGRGR